MRRFLSIALMLVIGLPLCTSLLGTAHATRLAACCRRSGTHHCMEMGEATKGEPLVHSVCPVYPHGASAIPAGVWTSASMGATSSHFAAQPLTLAQVEAGYRISLGHAQHKRGPPPLTN